MIGLISFKKVAFDIDSALCSETFIPGKLNNRDNNSVIGIYVEPAIFERSECSR